MHIPESKHAALVNLERQARWFAGFFHRTAHRIIDAPANDRTDKR